MQQPIQSFLADFSDHDAGDATVHSFRPREMLGLQPARSPAVHLGEAFAKGFDEGQSSLRAHFEAETARLAAEFEARLEGTRRELTETLAGRLATDLRQELDRVHSAIEQDLVAVLVPMLRCVLAERAIQGMAREMRRMTGDETAMTIELAGPEEVVHAVARRFKELGGAESLPALRLRPAPGGELTVTIDGTVLRSRLMEWLGRMAGVGG